MTPRHHERHQGSMMIMAMNYIRQHLPMHDPMEHRALKCYIPLYLIPVVRIIVITIHTRPVKFAGYIDHIQIISQIIIDDIINPVFNVLMAHMKGSIMSFMCFLLCDPSIMIHRYYYSTAG